MHIWMTRENVHKTFSKSILTCHFCHKWTLSCCMLFCSLFWWVFFLVLSWNSFQLQNQTTDLFFLSSFPLPGMLRINRNCWHLDGYICLTLRKYAPGSSSPTERTEGTEPLQAAARNLWAAHGRWLFNRLERVTGQERCQTKVPDVLGYPAL